MQHRKNSLKALMFLLAVTIVGCSFPPDSKVVKIYLKTDKTVSLSQSEINNDNIKKVAASANKFAWEFSSALSKEADKENFICSPFSAWLPITALINATEDEQKQDLLSALNMSDIDDDDINYAVNRMLYYLTQGNHRENYEKVSNPIKIANAVFVNYNSSLNKDFVQVFQNYYYGEAMNVNFSDSEAVHEVNRWSNEHTDGLIPNVLDSFDSNTDVVVTNSIYFCDRWEDEFNLEDTVEDIFYSPTHNTVAQYMLREKRGQEYYEDENIQAVSLCFKSGSVIYIFLPKESDAKSLLLSMDSEYFYEICDNFENVNLKLMLPRFKVEGSTTEISDTLKALNIPLFNEKVLTQLIENESLPLSSAYQNVCIDIDELGTTAAAVKVLEASW